MNELFATDDRVLDLAEAIFDKTASEAELAELDAMLLADHAARDRYLDYCRMQAALRLELRSDRAAQNVHQQIIGIESDDLPFIDSDATGVQAQSAAPSNSPVLGFLGGAYHGVTGYIGDHEWAQGVLGGTVFLALLFAVLGSIEIISRWRQANRPQPQDNEVVDVPAVHAAQLTGVFDCRWTGSFRPPIDEVLNVDDYINLASGLAEVTYDSGVKVLLQGPCTYKIESPSSGYLAVGRLTARVGSKLPSPGTDRRLVGRGAGGEGGGAGNEELRTKKEELPAPTSSLLLPTSSFVVNTPSATVTDLGTEFGVDVDGAGATDSLVFVGSVKVNTVVGDGQKQAGVVTLIENQSVRVERQGGKQYVVRRVEVKSDNFVRPDQIQDWLAMAREAAAKRKQEAEKPKEPEPDLTQFHKWEAFSNELRKRDDLLAYYDFQFDPNDKRDAENHELLRNKAKTAAGIFGRNYDGQLWGSISMGMIEGRFPGKTAIKFDCRGDEIRVNIPVKCPQLTLAAWIRLKPNPSRVGILLMSNGWTTPGQFCWQIWSDGSLAFGIRDGIVTDPSGLAPHIEPAGEFCGHWRQVAVASDSIAGKVAFYCDGQLICERNVVFGSAIAELGQGMIGDWDPSGIGNPERLFQGDIDELMLFNAVLSPEEIRRMYEAGKPATEDPKQECGSADGITHAAENQQLRTEN